MGDYRFLHIGNLPTGYLKTALDSSQGEETLQSSHAIPICVITKDIRFKTYIWVKKNIYPSFLPELVHETS